MLISTTILQQKVKVCTCLSTGQGVELFCYNRRYACVMCDLPPSLFLLVFVSQAHSFVLVFTTLSCCTYIHSLTPRCYNPCRVLADSRNCLQSSLSLALALQFLTPNFSASFVTPSVHLRFGLPARLLPSGLSKVIFLHGRLSCICITCPAHLRLPN